MLDQYLQEESGYKDAFYLQQCCAAAPNTQGYAQFVALNRLELSDRRLMAAAITISQQFTLISYLPKCWQGAKIRCRIRTSSSQ